MSVAYCAPTQDAATGKSYRFGAIALSDDCTIYGDWIGDAMVGTPGSSCVLPVERGERTVRVTDARVTFPIAVRQYRTQVPSRAAVDVTIGGTDAKGEHAVYRFTGTISVAIKADSWCERALPDAVGGRPQQGT